MAEPVCPPVQCPLDFTLIVTPLSSRDVLRSPMRPDSVIEARPGPSVSACGSFVSGTFPSS